MVTESPKVKDGLTTALNIKGGPATEPQPRTLLRGAHPDLSHNQAEEHVRRVAQCMLKRINEGPYRALSSFASENQAP